MFDQALQKKSKDALAILGESGLVGDAYLAGGTALALQLGHRVSVDFDFFTSKKFDEESLMRKFSSLPVNFQLERAEEGTVLGYINGTRLSLFFYDYPLLGDLQTFLNVNIAGVKDIAAMKIAAISDRGTKRDFVDVYFIAVVEGIYSLEDMLAFYDDKFKLFNQNKLHIIKSLTYFEDADSEKMPNMLTDVSWKEVKSFFENETRKLSKSKLLAS